MQQTIGDVKKMEVTVQKNVYKTLEEKFEEKNNIQVEHDLLGTAKITGTEESLRCIAQKLIKANIPFVYITETIFIDPDDYQDFIEWEMI